MRRAAAYIVLVFAIYLSALCRASSAAEPSEIVITLERTTCYGTCASYTVVILKDGTVNYVGREYVRVKGAVQWKVDPAVVDFLVKQFLNVEYFSLHGEYTTTKNQNGKVWPVTGDLPTTITSLNFSGKHKEIVDNLEADTPAKLRDLERAIDEAVNSKKWVSIDAETVHQKCNQGWDINGIEAQALLVGAVSAGDADVVRAFIEEGADVKKPVLSLPILCQAQGKEVFVLLIAAGADPNGQPNANLYPPLLNAANLGDPDSVAVLLKAGAKVDITSTDGTTALMVAARSGVPGSVKLLIAGADPAKKNELGWTAADFALNGEKYPRPLPPNIQANFEKIRGLLASTQNKRPD